MPFASFAIAAAEFNRRVKQKVVEGLPLLLHNNYDGGAPETNMHGVSADNLQKRLAQLHKEYWYMRIGVCVLEHDTHIGMSPRIECHDGRLAKIAKRIAFFRDNEPPVYHPHLVLEVRDRRTRYVDLLDRGVKKWAILLGLDQGERGGEPNPNASAGGDAVPPKPPVAGGGAMGASQQRAVSMRHHYR